MALPLSKAKALDGMTQPEQDELVALLAQLLLEAAGRRRTTDDAAR